jgi:hypothetical protein
VGGQDNIQGKRPNVQWHVVRMSIVGGTVASGMSLFFFEHARTKPLARTTSEAARVVSEPSAPKAGIWHESAHALPDRSEMLNCFIDTRACVTSFPILVPRLLRAAVALPAWPCSALTLS